MGEARAAPARTPFLRTDAPLAAANRERDERGWCVQLLAACEAGLAPGCGEHRADELAALYGARAAAAATVEERRALLSTVRTQAVKLVRAREQLLAALCSPASALQPAVALEHCSALADIMDAWTRAYGGTSGHSGDSRDEWSPWGSPWRGLALPSEPG